MGYFQILADICGLLCVYCAINSSIIQYLFFRISTNNCDFCTVSLGQYFDTLFPGFLFHSFPIQAYTILFTQMNIWNRKRKEPQWWCPTCFLRLKWAETDFLNFYLIAKAKYSSVKLEVEEAKEAFILKSSGHFFWWEINLYCEKKGAT